MISARVCYKSNLVPQWGESTMYQILPNEVQAVSLHACMHACIHAHMTYIAEEKGGNTVAAAKSGR